MKGGIPCANHRVSDPEHTGPREGIWCENDADAIVGDEAFCHSCLTRGAGAKRGPFGLKIDVASRGSLGLKLDDGKLRYELVDDAAEREFVGALSFGAVKYEPGNWRHVPDLAERYYGAARRHMVAARMGEKFDRESRMHHLGNAICCLHFWLAASLDEEDSISFETRLAEGLVTARRLRAERLAKAETTHRE